jgi:hypothetical protein
VDVPLERRVEISRVLRQHAQVMAQAVVELFVEDLWRRSVSDHPGDPKAWEELTSLLTRLRPLATASVAGFFDAALSDEAERAAEREFQAGNGD